MRSGVSWAHRRSCERGSCAALLMVPMCVARLRAGAGDTPMRSARSRLDGIDRCRVLTKPRRRGKDPIADRNARPWGCHHGTDKPPVRRAHASPHTPCTRERTAMTAESLGHRSRCGLQPIRPSARPIDPGSASRKRHAGARKAFAAGRLTPPQRQTVRAMIPTCSSPAPACACPSPPRLPSGSPPPAPCAPRR